MRSLSSAIIVAAALIGFTTAAFINHSDTQGFVMFVNGVVGLIGLAAWGKTILQPADPGSDTVLGR